MKSLVLPVKHLPSARTLAVSGLLERYEMEAMLESNAQCSS